MVGQINLMFDKRRKNKKADVAVTILIFMSVALCVGAFFVFLVNSNNFKENISEINALSKAYAHEKAFEIYLKSVGERVVEDLKTSDSVRILDLKTDAGVLAYGQEFMGKFEVYYASYSPEEYNIDYFKNQIYNAGTLSIIYDWDGGNIAVFEIKGFEFSENFPENFEIKNVKYVKDIKIEFKM